jgi:hypothetical protein
MLSSAPLSHERAAIARAAQARKRRPDDLEAEARERELRASYRARLLEEHIRSVVESLPPLSTEQRNRLVCLLTGASS